MCKHDTMYPGGVCAQMCELHTFGGCVNVCIYTYTYMLIHVCMQQTRYPRGGLATPARGGSQTAVISGKGRFLGFLMTGLVTQGVIFQTRKGRPIVLLIRVLWTDSRTWICRPIYGVLCGPIYALFGGTYGGYLGRGGTWYAITHMCVHPCVHTCVPPAPQHTSNTHVFV